MSAVPIISDLDENDISLPIVHHRIVVNGIERKMLEWAGTLGVTKDTMYHKYIRHGMHPIVFMHTKDYRSLPTHIRAGCYTKYIKPLLYRGKFYHSPGNRVEDCSLSLSECTVIPEELLETQQEIEIDEACAINLIYAMIADAKSNVKRKTPYAADSARFLLNAGQGLSGLLELIEGVDVESSLLALQVFVENHPIQ